MIRESLVLSYHRDVLVHWILVLLSFFINLKEWKQNIKNISVSFSIRIRSIEIYKNIDSELYQNRTACNKYNKGAIFFRRSHKSCESQRPRTNKIKDTNDEYCPSKFQLSFAQSFFCRCWHYFLFIFVGLLYMPPNDKVTDSNNCKRYAE